LWLALVVVLVVIAVVGGRPPEQGTPFDPDGVGPAGAKALHDTLEALGTDVVVTDEVDAADEIVLVLEDRLTEDQRDELVRWVDDGGMLVIADPFSPLTPLVVGDLGGPFGEDPGVVPPGRCSIGALDDAGPIQPGAGSTYEVGPGDGSCYDAFVVEAEHGGGVQRSVGGAGVFTNEHLGEADNAVLAAQLLDVGSGADVTWLVRDRSVAGEQGSLWALVSPGTRAALLQVAVAAVVYVLARGRRLGAPMRESQPVQLAGSELVAAVGNLMTQRRDPDLAASLLRSDLRRELCGRLGLAPDAPADLVARIVADRLPIDGARVERAVVDHPVPDDEALVALARDIEAVRQEVLHDRAPAQ
jgi:hypothetical protein